MNERGLESAAKSLMITGASSTGKTTLLNELTKSLDFLQKPDHTTRDRREGETENIDKIFLTVEQFIENHQNGWYLEPTLEFAVMGANYYGTPASWIEDINGETKLAFITIKTVARKIKMATKNNILWVHLTASESTRNERLIERNTNPAELRTRLLQGDSQGESKECDLMIDTSTVSIEDALLIIRRHMAE